MEGGKHVTQAVAPPTARSRALKEATVEAHLRAAMGCCTPYGSLESTERGMHPWGQACQHGCTPYGSLESTERQGVVQRGMRGVEGCTPYGSLESTERVLVFANRHDNNRKQVAPPTARSRALKDPQAKTAKMTAKALHPLRLAREH